MDCICYSAAQGRLLLPLARQASSTVMISTKAVYVDGAGHHSNSDTPPRFSGPVTEEQPTMPPGTMDYNSLTLQWRLHPRRREQSKRERSTLRRAEGMSARGGCAPPPGDRRRSHSPSALTQPVPPAHTAPGVLTQPDDGLCGATWAV